MSDGLWIILSPSSIMKGRKWSVFEKNANIIGIHKAHRIFVQDLSKRLGLLH